MDTLRAGQQIVVTVEIPWNAATQVGGDVVKAKRELAGIFADHHMTSLVLQLFNLKIEKFIIPPDSSRSLDILLVVCADKKDSPEHVEHFIGQAWESVMNVTTLLG
jgi:hypothetical protein